MNDAPDVPTILVGDSPAMEHVRRLVRRLRDAEAPVLIRGPSGSGKELVAQALHSTGQRARHPMLSLNCAALAPSLIESELFGHERGSFTHAVARREGCLEAAGEGTLFLDEVAELTPDLQAKLLRALQERRFRRVGGAEDVLFRARVVAATHQDLERRIEQGRFREDLYYRLNVVSIDVPPLHLRRQDVGLLAAHFAQRAERPMRFSPGSIAWLQEQPWPGNVRELRNTVERVALLCDEEEITVSVLERVVGRRGPIAGRREVEQLAQHMLAHASGGENKLLLLERTLICLAMEMCRGNKSRAAAQLCMGRKSLERRWQRICHEPPAGLQQSRTGAQQRAQNAAGGQTDWAKLQGALGA